MGRWSACSNASPRRSVEGTLTVNRQVLATDLRKGSSRREYEWGKITQISSIATCSWWRIGGQPMFTRNIKFKGCVLVELTGTSAQRLVASRDRLQYRYNDELDALLNELAVDTRSALKQQRAEYKRYQGEKVKARAGSRRRSRAWTLPLWFRPRVSPREQSPRGAPIGRRRARTARSSIDRVHCKQVRGCRRCLLFARRSVLLVREGASQGMGHDPEAALRVA